MPFDADPRSTEPPAGTAPRPLGSAPFQVSPLALGTWRTLERLQRDDAVALVRHAYERGIDFFDDARYDDETGSAPLPTGYSEVLFGEVFRAAGLPREGTVVSNKLWWQHWPRQNASEELAESLARMGFEYVDLIYAVTLPPGLAVEAAVAEVAGLLAAGLARAWGVANWSGAELREATAAAERLGIPPPAAVQLSYSLAERDAVEEPATEAALRLSGAGLVPSNVLRGGALTGKYARPALERGRGRLDDSAAELDPLRDLVSRLCRLAAELETTPAALAVAFALAHPRTASVLLGARSPAQLDENLEAIELVERLTASELERLRSLG